MNTKTSIDKQRIQFILISSIVALSVLGDSILYGVLPSKPEDFNVLVWQIGILLGVNRFVRIITNEWAGRMVENTGLKKPLLMAIISGSIITASYALPLGFWFLLSARIVWGACWSIIRVVGFIAVINLSSEKNRGRLFGIHHAIISIGWGGGVLLGGFLIDLIGIKPTFLFFSILSASGIILLWGLNRSGIPFHLKPEKNSLHIENSYKFFKNQKILTVWIIALLVTLTGQMIYNITGRLVADRINIGIPISIGIASLTGIILGSRTVGTLIIGPISGSLSDRIGRHIIIVIGCLIQIICIVILSIFKYCILLTIVIPISFFTSSTARIGITTMAGDQAQKSRTAIYMSRYSTFIDLGNAAGSFIVFPIYSSLGFKGVTIIAVIILLSIVMSTIGIKSFHFESRIE